MKKRYSILSKQNKDSGLGIRQEFAEAILKGLGGKQKSLPSKFIYDGQGSRLFKEITELPEYYLTRTEMRILEEKKQDICRKIDESKFNLVDLGCGDGRKTGVLVREFLGNGCDINFFPIDISEDAVSDIIGNLKKMFCDLKASGLVSEYFEGIRWLSSNNQIRNLVLFLGSNIGNFNPESTSMFLSSLWGSLNEGDYVLLGFDLKKDEGVMVRAYNDKKGITSDFNKNILRRINREFGADFDLKNFYFKAVYDPLEGAVQSYLISICSQEVFIRGLNKHFSFKKGEPIHTESSYKYHFGDIEEMAEANDFRVVENFVDPKNYFADSLWKVIKKK